MPRPMLRTLLALAICLLPATLVATPPASQADDVAQADALLAHGRVDEAWKIYDKMEKETHNRCSACELAMAGIRLRQGRWDDAWKLAARAMKNDPSPAAAFQAVEIQALSDAAHAGKKPDDKHLRQAEAEFRQALQLNPQRPDVLLQLAIVLLRQNRIDDGKAELQAFLQRVPDGPDSQRARFYLQNPKLVDEPLAPMFVAPLQDGGSFRLSDQKGKVVLLDFWATWCEPCRQALPDMIRFVHQQTGKPIVIVSISGDQDRDAWQKFTVQHEMNWPQIFDGAGQIRRIYNIVGIPTWVVIDGDGIIQQRFTGYGFGRTATIEQAVKKALKETETEVRDSSSGK